MGANLADAFEAVYCVNLDRRKDRWDEFTKELPDDWPFLRPERFPAIDGKKVKHPVWWKSGGGAWGCYRSHLHLIEHCLNRGIKSVLLLEDDAFCLDDFSVRAQEFFDHLPDNWGMVYLGGQHLFVNKHPPKKINDFVYRPYNVNRTHAFGLRGNMLAKVYKHLLRLDWQQAHHIDHHLGRLHQQRQDPIFCPRHWLVGQAKGQSNISGRTMEDRMWKAAAVISGIQPDSLPFVLVLGNHSSGSSAVAGVLHHLGLHLGNELTGYYGTDPNKNCGFEAVGLKSICEAAIPFRAVEPQRKKQWMWARLKGFLAEKRREAAEKGKVAAGKYPQLCRFNNQLLNVCGDKLYVVHCDRPLEESIRSMLRRTGKIKTGDPMVEAHLRWLDEGKRSLLDAIPSERKIDVSYAELLESTEATVRRILDFLAPLGVKPPEALIEKAVKYVKPEMRHIRPVVAEERVA